MPKNLRACPDCEREISLKAYSCPHCGCPDPFGVPLTEKPVIKPTISFSKTFFGGVWVFVKTTFWWSLGVGIIRMLLFGLANGFEGAAVGLGGGIAVGAIVGGIIGIFRMAAYWARGGPPKEDDYDYRKPTKTVKQKPSKPHKNRYLVKAFNTEYGPYSLKELRDHFDTGYFGADALVSNEGSEDWYDLNSKIDSL